MDEASEPPVKRRKAAEHDNILKINDTYLQNENIFSEAFCKRNAMKCESGAEVITDPFTCCVLPNFIQPGDYLDGLKQEVSELNFEQRINDLYQFKQSKELRDTSLPYLSRFIKLLREDMLKWLRNVTKLPLIEEIDISCSSYTFTDHLLCHDDELEDRRIAFIFYLVPEWNEEDGGNLDLFNLVDGQPNEVCKSIVPKLNNFVFFEVSPISYHQVSEVLTTKERIALSGWFHGPPREPFPRLRELDSFIEHSKENIDIENWINPMYLSPEIQAEIQETFEENSEISLSDFFNAEKYDEVCKALTSTEITWDKRGPPNRRIMYQANTTDSIPLILRECQALLCSEAFLLILSNLTALELHPACSNKNVNLGKVTSSIRKWCPGSYSLLYDRSPTDTFYLYAFMHFNCQGWDTSKYGGYYSFIDCTGEELLQIEPSPNSLSLVYVSEEVSHFVKYINCRAQEHSSSVFYDIYCTYIEDREQVNNGECSIDDSDD